jgi:hypothetical protein
VVWCGVVCWGLTEGVRWRRESVMEGMGGGGTSHRPNACSKRKPQSHKPLDSALDFTLVRI